MALDLSSDQVVADLRRLITEMEALLTEGGSKIMERLGDAGAELESRLHDAKDRLKAAERQARPRLRRAARFADRYAHDHPWHVGGAAVATGVMLGIVIGLALGSRRD